MTKILAALLLLTATAFPADLTLTWNANPPSENVTSYKVYERVGAAWVLLITVPAPNVLHKILGVSPGTHTYAVSAVSGTTEGVPSDPLTLPGQVLNLKAVITVTVP